MTKQSRGNEEENKDKGQATGIRQMVCNKNYGRLLLQRPLEV